MTYRGYTASVRFSEDDGVFAGRVIDLRDVISFEGTSVEVLRRNFEEAVDDYIAFCAERGEEPERPYSGKVALRMPPAKHRAVAVQAEREGESMNAFILGAIERALAERG